MRGEERAKKGKVAEGGNEGGARTCLKWQMVGSENGPKKRAEKIPRNKPRRKADAFTDGGRRDPRGKD